LHRYLSVSDQNKSAKAAVILSVLELLLKQCKVRFLKRTSATSQHFRVLGHSEARAKVGHALRDMAVAQDSGSTMDSKQDTATATSNNNKVFNGAIPNKRVPGKRVKEPKHARVPSSVNLVQQQSFEPSLMDSKQVTATSNNNKVFNGAVPNKRVPGKVSTSRVKEPKRARVPSSVNLVQQQSLEPSLNDAVLSLMSIRRATISSTSEMQGIVAASLPATAAFSTSNHVLDAPIITTSPEPGTPQCEKSKKRLSVVSYESIDMPSPSTLLERRSSETSALTLDTELFEGPRKRQRIDESMNSDRMAENAAQVAYEAKMAQRAVLIRKAFQESLQNEQSSLLQNA
jgi:hypothetical protein